MIKAVERKAASGNAAATRVLVFIAACIMFHAAYWTVFRPSSSPMALEFSSIAMTSASVAVPLSADRSDVAAANFVPIELPYEDCCEIAGYRTVRMVFPLDRVPVEGLGIYPIVGSHNYQLRVNGSLIFGEGRMDQDRPTYHGAVRKVSMLPAGVLKSGDNEIEFTLVRDSATPYYFVAAPKVGDYSLLHSAMSARLFRLNQWLSFSLSVGITISILALVVLLRSAPRSEIAWAFVLIAAWTAKLAWYEVMDPPVAGEMWLLVLYALVNLIPVAWLNFANSGNAAWRAPVAWCSLLSYAAVIAVTAVVLHWDLWAGVETIDFIGMVYSAVLALLAMGVFLYSLVRRGIEHVVQHAFFFLCLSLIVADSIAEITRGDFGDNVNVSMPLLVIGFVAAFLADNVRLFQSSAQLNALLGQQLSERTADLESAHLRERALIKSRAHEEERQRIMRDMHDGVGSHLMSMLMMARHGKANHTDYAHGLQTVIDEMRLMIDSMDSVGESLGAALSLFKKRVEPRLSAAGFQMAWTNTASDLMPQYSPREVLQVFRILQEGVTNALKHSGGDRIEIDVAPSRVAGVAITISICDNGRGADEVDGRGRGLDNMRARAESIGATVRFESSATGAKLLLDLPERSASKT